jgi:hypothetical protein
MRYQMDDVESEGLMKVWREFALAQISDCSPRDVAALFDLGKRLPGMFLKHHVGVFGQAANFVEQQKQLHVAAIHAVTTRDLIAPFLTKDQITDPLDGYAQFVGMPRVESEINYAYCSGLNIHPEALDFARIWINKIPSRWMKGASRTLYPLNAPLMLPQAQPQPTIGTNTRLTAVEAPVVQPAARAVEDPVLLPEPDADFDWRPAVVKEPIKSAVEVPVYDVAKDLGENPQSAIIAGVPGAGKGMITSNALRALKAKSPEIKIMVIDPKADPKEKAYWEGVCDVYRPRAFGAPTATPEDNTEWLLLRINEFKELKGPKLLVLDEGLMVCQTLKLAKLFDYQTTPDGKEKAVPIDAFGIFKNFLTYISSLGDSSDVWLWLVTQVINAGDLGISGGMRSIFRAIGIVSPKNRHAVNTFFATGFVPYPPGGLQGAYTLMDESPVDRAFYDGKLDKWMSMPELVNHSGWDRDKRASTNTKATKPPCSTEKQLQTLAEAGDVPTLESLKQALDKRVAANAEAMASLKGRN